MRGIGTLVLCRVQIAALVSMVTFITAWFRYRDVPGYSELHAARAGRT